MTVSSDTTLMEDVRVAIVQTTVDAEAAWAKKDDDGILRMSEGEQDKAWRQITTAFQAIQELSEEPTLVLAPELCLGRGYEERLSRLAETHNAIFVCGLDYRQGDREDQIVNEAVLVIPENWGDGKRSRRSTKTYIGKNYPAPHEEEALAKLGLSFQQAAEIYRFVSTRLGSFGVSICYDMMDLQRALLYQGQIQHLFILAYNKDIRSFYHLAEALSRTLYANVVICNTGRFGGSLATAPLYRPEIRTIYRHEGQKLFTFQVVRLPVRSLLAAQRDGDRGVDSDGRHERPLYKNAPPGYEYAERSTAKALTNIDLDRRD